jgi:hypothetical protein
MRKETMALTGLLSLPAFLGILSWIVSWLIPHKGSLTLIIEEIFVVMVWIGPITSTIALVVNYKNKSISRKSIPSYLLNGTWLVISLCIIGLYCYVRSK